MRMNKTHRVKAKDKKRILCQQCHAAAADLCEHTFWQASERAGISFFYYCDPCWKVMLEEVIAIMTEAV